MNTTTLTNEDREIAKRGDCAGDINLADRMMLADRADYRVMLASAEAKWNRECEDYQRAESEYDAKLAREEEELNARLDGEAREREERDDPWFYA